MAKCVISGVAPGGDTTGLAKIQTGSYSDGRIVLKSVPKLLVLTQRTPNADYKSCTVDVPLKRGIMMDTASGKLSYFAIEVNGNTITIEVSVLLSGNYIAIG